MNIKKVLIALDYDPTAQKVAEIGFSMAKAMHADIIVMGSHSRKWLEKILMGSVTEKVFSNTTLPIFIIPTKKHS
ncbi:MAG: universal stress protein [Bacteroidetes bacterium]|nr:universal stress protein [Bacteroidota bacterium]